MLEKLPEFIGNHPEWSLRVLSYFKESFTLQLHDTGIRVEAFGVFNGASGVIGY